MSSIIFNITIINMTLHYVCINYIKILYLIPTADERVKM